MLELKVIRVHMLLLALICGYGLGVVRHRFLFMMAALMQTNFLVIQSTFKSGFGLPALLLLAVKFWRWKEFR